MTVTLGHISNYILVFKLKEWIDPFFQFETLWAPLFVLIKKYNLGDALLKFSLFNNSLWPSASPLCPCLVFPINPILRIFCTTTFPQLSQGQTGKANKITVCSSTFFLFHHQTTYINFTLLLFHNDKLTPNYMVMVISAQVHSALHNISLSFHSSVTGWPNRSKWAIYPHSLLFTNSLFLDSQYLPTVRSKKVLKVPKDLNAPKNENFPLWPLWKAVRWFTGWTS